MRIVVGLGNPGRQYRNTRHNVGFMAAEEFLARHGRGEAHEERGCLVAEARWAGGVVLVARPQDFMNLSGPPVAALMRAKRASPADLVLVYDDADLEFGRIRVRPGGRPAGHRGVASIVEGGGTQEIPRVRLGIGRPGDVTVDLADHVLEAFEASERAPLGMMILEAAEVLEVILRDGVKIAMNRYNRRRGDEARGA